MCHVLPDSLVAVTLLLLSSLIVLLFVAAAVAEFVQIELLIRLLCNFEHSTYGRDFYLMILYMLPINKIYIDSRHRTQSSESDTDFEIQLKQTINLPENCTCVVSDVMLKNTITTIERFNENVYVRANNVDKIIKLDNRIYNIRDFGDHLTYRMNLAFMPVPGAFTPGLFQFLEDVYNSVVLLVLTTTNT